MKTPKQWVDENSKSGPFDLIDSTEDAEEIVRQIQEDAISEWKTIATGLYKALSKTRVPDELYYNIADADADHEFVSQKIKEYERLNKQ